jgi:hypothetical protein
MLLLSCLKGADWMGTLQQLGALLLVACNMPVSFNYVSA